MIGAVTAFRPLRPTPRTRQATPRSRSQARRLATPTDRPERRPGLGSALRVLTLLVVIGIILGSVRGEDAVAQPATATPTPKQGPTSAPVRPAQVGNFISGTIWDDTRVRNGVLDDNEVGLAGVTVTITRVDVPASVGCVGGSGGNINPTDSNGRYRCEGMPAGNYRVTIAIPTGFEATTRREREVTVTATEGGQANFGLASLDTRIRSIGGVVFLDCNENGIRDLPVEFDNRPSSGAFDVTLERIDGRTSQDPTSTRQNQFAFENLDSGTYVVVLRVSSSNYKATTATRREVTVGTTFGANVDFGIVDQRSSSDCADAAASTATAVAATAGVAVTRTVVAALTQTTNGSTSSGSLPPPAATAVAVAASRTSVAATATAARFTPTPTATPIPTATQIPTNRLERAYPRSARFVMQAVARYPDGRREDMLAEGALIGLETVIFQDSGQRVGSEQLSMRIKRNERVDDIVVTAQEAYRQRGTDEFWRTVPYEEIRNELGLLAPLDAIVALRCISRGQEGGQAVVDGTVTRYLLGEVDALRFWETSIRPKYSGGGGGGGQTAPTISGGAVRTTGGRVIPSCTPPPQTRIDAPSVQGAQPVYQSIQVEAWVGLEDGLIRSERFTARVMPPISDPKRMPDPIDFDLVITYSDVNKPITIIPPPVPTPTAVPTVAPAVQPGAAAPAAQPGAPAAIQPAPQNGLQAPTPGLPGLQTPEPLGTPDGVIEGGLPEQPSGPTPSQREQALAAERALVAIATGGQPRTGSFGRGNSIYLDVPFRTQQDNSAYAPTNSGAASLAMALGGYGTDVAVSDLRALLNGLEGTFSPGAPARIETIARVAERGGLNVLDLYRGARFNEWTIEQVREMIRRGYPVMTLVQGAVLPGGTPPGVARERYIVIIGIEGDELIYHDPAYPDEGTGAARRTQSRIIEQGWLAASTPRLAAGFSLGPEGRGLLDDARGQVPPGSPVVGSPTPRLDATVPVIATLEPPPTPTPPEYPFGLPVHPLLVLFWLVLVVLLLVILVRSLR